VLNIEFLWFSRDTLKCIHALCLFVCLFVLFCYVWGAVNIRSIIRSSKWQYTACHTWYLVTCGAVDVFAWIATDTAASFLSTLGESAGRRGTVVLSQVTHLPAAVNEPSLFCSSINWPLHDSPAAVNEPSLFCSSINCDRCRHLDLAVSILSAAPAWVEVNRLGWPLVGVIHSARQG